MLAGNYWASKVICLAVRTQRFTTTATITTANACGNVNAAGGGGGGGGGNAGLFVTEKYGDLSEDEEPASTAAAGGSYVATGRRRSGTFQKVRPILPINKGGIGKPT